MNLYKFIIKRILIILALMILILPGCTDFLQENPQNELSEGTFWKTRSDALMGLMGCYERLNAGWITFDGWVVNTVYFGHWTDESTHIRTGAACRFPYEGIRPSNSQVEILWRNQFTKISRVNYFLENIDNVEMDSNEKAELIAEAKVLRAYSYFWLSQLFGNVPIVDKLLTFDEANNIGQGTQDQAVSFALNDVMEAADDLPVRRPASEKGRIEKGVALAIKGRLLMAEQRWSEAAATYKEIIDLNRYIIDPRFKKLFEDEGDNSDEYIFSTIYTEGEDGQRISQLVNWPSWYDGNNGLQFYQEFVDHFLMNDGKSIEESPLYDPENPFENRDPRLYHTVLLPGYSDVNGRIFQGHPDSIAKRGQFGPDCTGYAMNKFHDRGYDGTKTLYGGDYPLIRYAEVLLSYLESKLEAGENITQALLDNTINQIRARPDVGMPPVTETDINKLREIVRRERAVELAGEGGIRYWDLLRWEKLVEVFEQTFHGMKITDNPEGYTGSYKINDKGHLIMNKFNFYEYNYLWPIPLDEIDVNPNLIQNPGYN